MNETGLSLLKSNVIKPGSELHSKLESRLTVTDFRSLNNATVYYEDEIIIVHGKSRTVRRLFVNRHDSDYDGIGWIINEDITQCMVCTQSFGFFRWPHHCRCCGNLVCNSCSPEVAVIFELAEMGEVRVCIQCYWGQDPVHVSNIRRDSDESSTESNPENEMDYYFSDHELGSLESATPRSSQSMKLKLIIPVPAFVLDTSRKLSFKELGRMNVQNFATRKVFINICVHSCVPIITHGGEYFVSDDVAVVPRDAGRDTKSKYSSIQDGSGSGKSEQDSVEYEVYHVLVDPNSLRASLSTDPHNMEKTDQLMMRIIRQLAIKFQLGLSKRFEQLADCVYMGGSVTSMYVPFTGSELDDDDDDDLRDKAFSLDDGLCSDDESDSVPSNRSSEQEGNRSLSTERVSLSADLKDWERRVSIEQTEQQAVDAAVQQLVEEVRESEGEVLEEWEHKMLIERKEQREFAKIEAEALAVEVQRLADQELAAQQLADQLERERIASKEREEREEEETRRVAAVLKADNESKAAAERSAIERRNMESAAAILLATDKATRDQQERDRAAAKVAALAVAEAQRAQNRLDKEARLTAARAEKEKIDADARAAAAQKEAEIKLANDRSAREQTAAAERLAAEQQERDEKVRQLEQQQRNEDELLAAAAAEALAAETARVAKEIEDTAAADQRRLSEADASRAAASRRASQNKLVALESSPRSSEPPLIVVQIPEINVVPTAWCVIKTKTADMTKCFVNVGFHGALPNITETSHDTTAHEEYLNANFVQYTLNKKRCVMFVGSLRSTSDKDGSSCTLCDVTISVSAYNLCTKDETLVDKLFIKILKALKKQHGVDLDADYKLPKILKNYKGTDVLTVNVPAFRSNTATKLGPRFMGPDSMRSLSVDIAGDNPMVSPIKGPSSPVPNSSSGTTTGNNSASSPKRVSIVNPEWNQKWSKFVPAGKNIIYTSQIGKKNAMGITIVRQLLLTDEPSLLYVDAVSMTHKGDIEWLRSAPPKATFVDASNFDITVAKRVYKFTDRENNAALWVRKINEVAASTV